MNICLVSREYPPETGWGGIGTYTYNLAHGLSSLSHNVHVIAHTPGEERDYMDGGVRVHRVNARNSELRGLWRLDGILPAYFINYSRRVAWKALELRKKYSIEIVETPEWCAEGFLYSFKKQTPLVVRFHTPTFLLHELNSLPLSASQKVICWLEKVASLKADIATSPSSALAQIMAKAYGMKEGRIRVVPNPVDEDLFKPDKACREELSVLFVGRLETRKGVDLIKKAIPEVVRAIPGVKFTFIGKDLEYMSKRGSVKQDILDETGAAGNLEFIEHIPREKLARYYQKSSICIVPSLWENFPCVCLEAMSCATPVLGSDAGGMKEIISDGQDGVLFESRDPKAFAAALIKALSEPERLRAMGDSARQKVETCFSRSVIAEKTASIYSGMLRA